MTDTDDPGLGTGQFVEFERVLTSFPLIGRGTKERMRVVFAALRAQHEERMVEWRRELQAASTARPPETGVQHEKKLCEYILLG